MKTEELDDEAFSELLKSIARTPDVSGLRQSIGPGSELSNRFVVGRRLGEGGMGRVFAAFDRVRQVEVAIKLLGVLTPHSIAAMKREFRSAEQLVHRNLVRLHEFFSDGDEWFFTMDLLHGVTVRQLCADRPSPDPISMRHVFRQLAEALSELHEAGTLHGDLKPSNFLIVGAERRVVLLDFGVSRPLNASASRYPFAGTREYAAPEQARGGPSSTAADWYSFGVVLFEALTGQLPTTGALDSQLSGAAGDLGQLCAQLLQESAELRPDGAAVRLALGDTLQARPVMSLSSSGAGLALVGRFRERQLLRAAYERAISGGPEVALVRGDSGIGKTALLDDLLQDVKGRGATVLRSRCRERESTSYKAVDGLIEDLVDYLDQLPREEAARALPADIDDLTRLFPTLRTAAAVVAHSIRVVVDRSDQSVIKRNAVSAFKELLIAISRRAPLVLCIDDLQWSDRDSAALLLPILSAPSPARVWLVGGCRALDGSRGTTLDVLYAQSPSALPDPLLIDLEPLDPTEAESLARDLLPQRADREFLARYIAREAAGSPLFIAELVHQETALARTPARAPHLRSLSQLVGARIAALPDHARGLLEATALAGIPLSDAAARRCQGLTPNQTEDAMDLLRASRLARTHGAGEGRAIDMHHDRIREIVRQSLAPDLRRQHHLRLARVLAADPSEMSEVLASHFQAGGDMAEASRYWLRSADAAFEALAFGHAAELYQRVAESGHVPSHSIGGVLAKRAEALAYDGRARSAADVYLVAAQGQAREYAIELRRRAAEQLLLSGYLDQGLEVIGLVLHGLGMRGTRTGRRALYSILLGRLRVRWRGLRFQLRQASELSERELARVDASWSIACSLGVVDFLRGVDFQTDHLLLALKAGEPRRLLRAMTLEISYAATPGRGSHQRTAELLRIADELAERVNDPAAVGLVHVSRGVAAYLNGRFGEAVLECQAGVAGMRRYSGMLWETVTAQRFVVAALFHLGRLKTLAELVPPLLTEAEGTGNLYASVFFRSTYANAAWLVQGDVVSAREQLTLATSEWRARGTQLPHCWLLVGEANLAHYTGDTEHLWARLERDWPRFVAAQFLRVGMLRVQLWQLRARAALAEAQRHRRAGRAREAQRYNREARRCAGRLGKQSLAFATPLAELIYALAECQLGDLAPARKRLEDCVAKFDALDMGLYAAAASARLGQVLGGDTGAALVHRAKAAFTAEGVIQFTEMVNLLAPEAPS